MHLTRAFLLSLALALHLPAFAAERITILQLNDVYQISPVEKGKRGGMARVATLQKQIRAENPNTLFLVAGDFISPSLATSVFQGRHMIDTMGASGVDLVTLGNHEFDQGPDVLRERMKESKFEWVITNVTEKATKKPFGGAKPWALRTLGKTKVGVFGVLLPETAQSSSPGPGVEFEDPIVAAKRAVKELRKQGAQVIVALTHLEMPQDKALARAVPEIDVIVGGHEHEVLEALVGRTLVLKMGSDAKNLGRIDLTVGDKKVESIDWAALPVTDQIKDEPETAKVIAEYENKLNKNLAETIGTTEIPLDARAATVRAKESNLGNFIADAYRKAMDADVGFVYGGNIRSDVIYEAGPLTKRDAVSILPFQNPIVKIRLTGAMLRRALENGVSKAPDKEGRFPHVSGLTFTYDPTKPAGKRVVSAKVGEKPLEDTAKYTLALSAYVFGGGDAYDFKGAEVLVKAEEGPSESELLIKAIQKGGTIAPKEEGRIREAKGANESAQWSGRFEMPLIANFLGASDETIQNVAKNE